MLQKHCHRMIKEAVKNKAKKAGKMWYKVVPGS